ncbi:MAG TPA: glycosyltransferase family A protein, partial [Gemmatimonadaceae bacterium]|nr:glycosyltransferase family A protein [Gemmatimonadaceae bacterium]
MPTWLVMALPWIALPALLAWRARGSVPLASYPPRPGPPGGDGLVSVVVPARNEAHNIEPCVRSILASGWHSLEVIVVDDHSTDGTGDIVRRIAAG